MNLHYLKTRKIGFVGAGNMGQSIIGGLIGAGYSPDNLFASTRTEAKSEKLRNQFKIKTFKNNEELVDHCDIVILAVKPQDLYDVVEPIAKSFMDSHLVISLAAGINLITLQKWLPDVRDLVRVMPNTAIKNAQAVIGYTLGSRAGSIQSTVEDLFSPLGVVFHAEEGEAFQALTVSSSSGIGFVFELMQYWQHWIEDYGFSEKEAREMTIQTFLGATEMAAQESNTDLEELQAKVVSKKGVTHAGLTAMRELEIEGLLRMSFEKAVLRDTQLGKPSIK